MIRGFLKPSDASDLFSFREFRGCFFIGLYGIEVWGLGLRKRVVFREAQAFVKIRRSSRL